MRQGKLCDAGTANAFLLITLAIGSFIVSGKCCLVTVTLVLPHRYKRDIANFEDALAETGLVNNDTHSFIVDDLSLQRLKLHKSRLEKVKIH